MSVASATNDQVKARAAGRCQFCRMHQSLQGATFHIEHVIPVSAGGTSDLSNLVLACPSCNLHKANRVDAVDPQTGLSVRLFHPLNDVWQDHFEWRDCSIVGRTAMGRATVDALRMNDPRRIKVRQAEAMFALFPPE